MENRLVLPMALMAALLTGCFGSSNSSESDELSLESSGLVGVWQDNDLAKNGEELYLEFTADGRFILWQYEAGTVGKFSNCYWPLEYSPEVIVTGSSLYIEPVSTSEEAYFLYNINENNLTLISDSERSITEDDVEKDYSRVLSLLSPVCFEL